jgi:hypothetical protein
MRGASGGAVPKLPGYADRIEAWCRKWEEERDRPIAQRQFFSLAEIATRLARDPRSLTIDPAIRERVGRDLAEWVQTLQFRAGEVVTLGGDPPDFRPLGLPLLPAGGGIILLPEETVALRRSACRRYAQARAELPGVAGLLRDWFTAARSRLQSTRKGRVPQPIWTAAKAEAMRWLADNGHPVPGDGGQTRLEQHIADWLALRGHHPAESTVRSHVVEWIDESEPD